MLFGLHINTFLSRRYWIFKANATEILDTPKKVREYFLSSYGDNAGFAQQYIFYYAREHRDAGLTALHFVVFVLPFQKEGRFFIWSGRCGIKYSQRFDL